MNVVKTIHTYMHTIFFTDMFLHTETDTFDYFIDNIKKYI
jgi:hypothetical protein